MYFESETYESENRTLGDADYKKEFPNHLFRYVLTDHPEIRANPVYQKKRQTTQALSTLVPINP